MVIGGGNSAAEECLFLTRFADKITMLVREDSMSASSLIVAKALNIQRSRYGLTRASPSLRVTVRSKRSDTATAQRAQLNSSTGADQ